METDRTDFELRLQRNFQGHKSRRDDKILALRHIARYVRPEHCEFFEGGGTSNISNVPAIEKLWDDTPIGACGTWARGVNSMSHNQATVWFGYEDEDGREDDDSEVKAWYKDVNDDLRKEFKTNGAYLGLLHRLTDVGAYGYGAVYSYEEDNEGHVTFEYVPAPEALFKIGRNGLCRHFYRILSLDYLEAEDRGITIAECDEPVQQAKRDRDTTTKFTFIHYVAPAKDFYGESFGINKDFIGVYFEEARFRVLNPHGFYDMPYHVLCWDPVPGSNFPIGIGYKTLPEIRNLNAWRKKLDRILDNESDSPILTTSQDEVNEQAYPQPGEYIYGGMSGNGQRLYDPLYKNSGASRSLENEVRNSQNKILEAWHNNLMLMIANGQMTATEVASRDEKIIQAMGPFIIPMMADLRTIVERVFHARMRAGAYDPLPEAFGPGTNMKLEFSGILAKAAKKIEAMNVTMFYAEALGTVGQVAPDKVKSSLRHDDALRKLADARSVDDLVLSKDEIAAEEERNAQAAMQQQMLESAPGLAKAAKDGVQAMNEMGQGANGQGISLAP